MLKKKNGIIAALTLSGLLVLGGGVFAYEEIQEKEEMVAVQKENLSQLETEKEALEQDKATNEKEIAEKDKAIKKVKDSLSEKEKALKAKEDALKEKNDALKKKDEHIEELKEDLSAKAKREAGELKAKKEVVVASAAPTSSSVKVQQASAPRVEKKEEVIIPSRSNNEPSGRTFYVEATAYVALCDTGCTGITATGINLLENPGLKVIAVDPSVIPLGSKVHVEGYGYAIAGDTGGAIKGNRIDLYMQNHADAVAYGRQSIKITILE